MNNKRFLAIDWGRKKVGLAVSDPFNTYAIPIKPIANSINLIDDLIKVIKDQNINIVIIGYPLLKNNKESDLCKTILDFANKLKKTLMLMNLNIDFYFQNEFYTTKKAKENLESSVVNKKNWDLYKDSYAAQVILEDFFISQLER